MIEKLRNGLSRSGVFLGEKTGRKRSFIALFIGLVLKSSMAAVISSFLLILLTQANIGDFTMKDQWVFPVILTLISLILARLSACSAETKDLMWREGKVAFADVKTCYFLTKSGKLPPQTPS